MNNLRFADHVVIVAVKWEDLKEMLEELSCKGREAGMEVNISKTKIISNSGQKKEIKIEGKAIEIVDSVTYLSQTVSF